MRKWMVFLLLVAFASPAFAAQRGTPEYEQLKAMKKKEREAKAQKSTSDTSSNASTFWQREAERSGFAGTGKALGSSISGFFSSAGSGMNKAKTK